MYKNEEIRFHELDRSQFSYPREIEFEMTIIKDRKAEVRWQEDSRYDYETTFLGLPRSQVY